MTKRYPDRLRDAVRRAGLVAALIAGSALVGLYAVAPGLEFVWLTLKANGAASQENEALASIFADMATVLGVWMALTTLLWEKHRERRDREYSTYDALDSRYADFLALSANHPELNLHLWGEDVSPRLSPSQIVQRLAYFEILVSLFERAFLMYRQHPSKTRIRQWAGWDAYIQQWVRRSIFPTLWCAISPTQFDADFVSYVEDVAKALGVQLKPTTQS